MKSYFDMTHAPGIVAAMKTFITQHADAPKRRRLPFITIAREAGAGGHTLAAYLAERLNEDKPSTPWQCFDRELIEKVAEDHDLSAELVERLPDSPQSWFRELMDALKFEGNRPTDEVIYQKMIATIRGVADMGHTILVGRGANLCTRGIPGGIHIHLYAPLPYRIAYAQQTFEMSDTEATDWVKKTDLRREAFLSKFWPTVNDPDHQYSLKLNSGEISVERQATIILSLLEDVRRRLRPAD